MGRGEASRPVTLASGPCAQAVWTKDGAAVVYPCHAVIVVLCVDTREQRFFLGHTDKVGTACPSQGRLVPIGWTPSLTLPSSQVSALALDGSSSLLASAQAGPASMLRLWDFQTRGCLSLSRSPVHTLCSLRWARGLRGGGGPAPATLTACPAPAVSPAVGCCSAASARTPTGER